MEKDEQVRLSLEQSMAHHQRMATEYVERHQDEARTEERNVVGQLPQAFDQSERQFADRERAYQNDHFQAEQIAIHYGATIQNLEDLERQRERAGPSGSMPSHALSDSRIREAQLAEAKAQENYDN